MPLLINGQRIEDEALSAEFASVKGYYERLGNVSCCERDEEFRGYARDNVVARVLLAQRAIEAIPLPSPGDLDQAIAKLIESHGGERAFFAAIGAGPDQLDLVRQDVQINLQVEKLIDQAQAGEPQPSESELREYYQRNILAFYTEEQVRASHISKAPPRGEERQRTYDLFREIRGKLLTGDDFDELAREHSDRGKEEIDLGWFGKGDLPVEFEMVAFSMNTGEISPVFGSAVGFHIVKVTDRRPAVPRPFDEVRDPVRQMLMDERRQTTVRLLVEQLKGTAEIQEL
jgi:parvulin-like peptidyl-prolyl isomerase